MKSFVILVERSIRSHLLLILLSAKSNGTLVKVKQRPAKTNYKIPV